jgi:hypothetical protein
MNNPYTRPYTRGDAAAYWAWLGRQTPEVARIAAQFRPWEIYQLQGHDILVRIVDYDPSGELLYVMYLDPSHKGGVIPVVPTQIDLWGILGQERVGDLEPA